MQAFASSEGVASFGGKDPHPRGTMLTRIKLDMWCDQQVEGHFLSKGTWWVDVLSSQVDKIRQLMVWDDREQERIDNAKAMYAKRVDNEFSDRMQSQGSRMARDFVTKARELRDRHASYGGRGPNKPEALTAEQERVLKERDAFEMLLGSLNWVGVFHDLHDRAPMPIKSMEVVSERLPLPDEVAKMEHDSAAAEAVANAVARVMSGDAAAELLKRLEALEADNQALKSRLAGGDKGKA